MDKVFKALADRSRRAILDRLLKSPGQSLSQLVEGLEMTRQSATRHISVLQDASLVACHWRGREKLHYLNPMPIAEINRRWIDKFSQQRVQAIANLKQALEESQS